MSGTAPSTGPLKILLAEDEAPARQALEQLLTGEGHEVTAVEDGTSAFESIRSDAFDVALLDINMPGMTGWQVAMSLQENDVDPRPVLIAITSFNRRRDREKSRNRGFTAHLGKPFDYSYLRELLGSLAERN